MIKTAFKLLIAVAILNAVFRGGTAAWTHYRFTDGTQQLIRFGAGATTQELHDQILTLAAELDVPVEPQNVSVRREGTRTVAEAAYTQPVELAPGFVYPVDLDFSVDALALRPATADDRAQ